MKHLTYILCYSNMKSDSQKDHPVLLFDGVCNLCNGFVQFVIQRDNKGFFRFTALQSDVGQGLQKEFQLVPNQLDTVILIYQNKVYTHSDVALQIAKQLGGLWSVFTLFSIIPKSSRDAIYNWIAKNRYRWFGKQEACMLPRPEWENRFL